MGKAGQSQDHLACTTIASSDLGIVGRPWVGVTSMVTNSGGTCPE